METEARSDLFACTECHVCGAVLPPPDLDLGLQPMCDDLVEVGDERVNVSYPIQISMCPICYTAHQVWQIRKETLFPSNYHYRPRFTQDVLSGMEQLVAEVAESFLDLSGKLVCDVGCNDGSLLNFFKAAGARTCGIEPTGAAKEAEAGGHHIVHGYFDSDSARALINSVGRPDVVTFTNVFAHIEDLNGAIEALKLLVHDGTVVVIENHYLGTVLATNQFDTFYHEHPRTYSIKSFEVIADRLGGSMVLAKFPKRYGGNVRVYIANFDGGEGYKNVDAPADVAENAFPSQLKAMQEVVNAWKADAVSQLAVLKSAGVVLAGKSFPGRAAILTTLLEISTDDLVCVYEKPGSLKLNHYVPGTRIPVVSDDRWISGEEQPDGMLILGWHIVDEIAEYVRKLGYNGRIFAPLPKFVELHP